MAYIAKCTSIQCNGREIYHIKSAITVDVPKTTICCPKCDSVLFWTIEGKKVHRAPASTSVSLNRHRNIDNFRFKT